MINFTFPTFTAISDYKHQMHMILINTYERAISSYNAAEVRAVFGDEGVYDQLLYHQKMVLASCELCSSDLLSSYLVWRTHVLRGRTVDLEYLLEETEIWSQTISSSLFQSYSNEFISLYNQIMKFQKDIIVKPSPIDNNIFTPFLSYLLEGKLEEAKIFFESKKTEVSNPSVLLDTVIKDAMQNVGYAWEHGLISVAKEHLATSLVERLLDTLYINNDSNSSKGFALIIIPEEQLHKLGARMIEKILHTHGWSTAFLNLSNDFSIIKDAVIEVNPQLIVISTTLAVHIPLIQNFINELKKDFEMFSGKIAAGGSALYCVEPPILLEHVDFQSNSLRDFETFLESL